MFVCGSLSFTLSILFVSYLPSSTLLFLSSSTISRSPCDTAIFRAFLPKIITLYTKESFHLITLHFLFF